MGRSQKCFLTDDLLDPWPTLTVPSPAIMTPLPANIFPNRFVPNVPNSILRNPHFCSFVSFLTISLIPPNNNPESSRD